MNNFKIAIDNIVIGYDSIEKSFNVLLSKRINAPNKGSWALPGGFVKKTEEFEDTAYMILEKETGVKNLFMDQLKAYSLTDSTDSNRIISIAFYSVINLESVNIKNGNQLTEWFNLKNVLMGPLPQLPFDHGKKVQDTVEHIKAHVNTRSYLYKLLPEKFTLNQVHSVYQSLFNVEIDNRNFRKRLKKLDYLEQLNELESNVSRRPGYLFRFNEKKFNNSLGIM